MSARPCSSRAGTFGVHKNTLTRPLAHARGHFRARGLPLRGVVAAEAPPPPQPMFSGMPHETPAPRQMQSAAMHSPSPLAPARTHETTSSCPSSTRAGAFVARSHSITCLSFDPEASPFGEFAARKTKIGGAAGGGMFESAAFDNHSSGGKSIKF